MPASQTLTYKTVGSLPIHLDLHLPSSPTGSALPILIWFHGGGLLQGTRSSVSPHMLDGVENFPYALVAADYRLAPQVPLQEIISDVQDCLQFVAQELPKHTGSVAVDPSRLAVSGSSAGGYLALLAGLYATVPIKVILAIYPITNPHGRFFTTPQPIPSDLYVEESALAPYLDRNASPVAGSEPDSPRGKFYFYMLRKANLAELLRVEKDDEAYVVAVQLKKRPKADYPPTYVVHGDADKFVGVEQAEEVVDVLKGLGVDHRYDKLPGVDHMFDKDPRITMEEMYGFMKKYLV